MASGFNGQSFAFCGISAIQPADRAKALKTRIQVYAESQSQLFIETPYRNMKMLEEIINTCRPDTKLCVAVDITLDCEFIQTKSLKKKKSITRLK